MPAGDDYPQNRPALLTMPTPMFLASSYYKDEYLAYERRLSLMSPKEKRKHVAPYLVKKSNKRTNDTIRYRYVLPYESWMADAKLNVQRDECGCGESTLMSVQPVMTSDTRTYFISLHCESSFCLC